MSDSPASNGNGHKKNGKRPLKGAALGAVKPWEPSPLEMEVYAEVTRGVLNYIQIAAKFDISTATITVWKKKIEEWLVPQYAEGVRELKAQHTEMLMHVFREAMAAWEASKRPGASRTTTSGKDGTERRRTVKGQNGDARYLAEAQKALDSIRAIWGANAPIEMKHSGEMRVAGVKREDAIRNRLTMLQDALRVPSSN